MRGAVRSEPRSTRNMEKLGLEVAPLDADVAKQLGMTEVSGVVITSVRSNSLAANAGLNSGMVIVQVNRQPIETVDEFVSAMEDSGGGNGTLLLVRTESGSRFVVLK